MQHHVSLCERETSSQNCTWQTYHCQAFFLEPEKITPILLAHLRTLLSWSIKSHHQSRPYVTNDFSGIHGT